MRPEVLEGDVREVLKTLDDESVQCVVTSPPYWGLRDYGTASWEGGDEDCEHTINDGTYDPKKGKVVERPDRSSDKSCCTRCGAKRIDAQLGLEPTPEEYVEKMVGVFREVKRVLRKDGTVWLNLGDSYAGSNGSRGITENTPSVKKGDKVLLKRIEGRNFTEHKDGGMPIISPDSIGLKHKDLIGIPWRVALALQADGWYLRSDIIWNKPNPMPESVRDRPTKSHEYIFLLTKSAKYYYDHEAIKEKGEYPAGTRAAKASDARSSMSFVNSRPPEYKIYDGTRNKRSVWKITTKPYKEAHFATFPEELPETCIKAGTKRGDVVLDIFAGSGTTLRVASKLGRKGIGIELNPEYIKILKKRCKIESMSLEAFA